MAVIPCANFTDLQNAVNTANGGDELTLTAGATYSGNLTLPKRTGVSSKITIRTNAASGDLPTAGTRIDPTYIPFCATLSSPNTVPVIDSAKGAHHFKFKGIYFPAKANGFGNQINMGGDHGSGATLADVCTDMEFDQCVGRGHPVAGQLRFAHVGVTHFRLTNSYFDRYGAQGQQSNILSLINGEGDHVITNNYFSGSTQPILYGGGSIRSRVVTFVVSATLSSAVLDEVTDLRVGQRIAFLAEGGTRRRWPKCLSVDSGTKTVTFETLDVVPDSPGEARWGVVEKGIVIAGNYISHDINVVLNGVMQPTTGVARSAVAGGSFNGSTSATYAVQAKASGYTSQEARGAASSQTSSITPANGQAVRVTWSAVTNAEGYYVYRTSGGVITRHTVGNVLTFDDPGTGGTVVGSIPSATTMVGWIGIEFKQGIDVHVHSNIIENTYKGSFGGECLLVKCANQEGTASFLSTENVLIENNVCRNTWGFGTVSGSESGVTFTMDIQPKPVENLTFRNNLCYNSKSANLGAGQSALSRYMVTIVNGAKNVKFLHNTIDHEGTGCYYIEKNTRGSIAGFVSQDNMLRGNTYFVSSNNGFGTTGVQNATDGDYVFSTNVISTPSNSISQVTPNNTYEALATWKANFVEADGADIADYALAGGSPYNNAASDGTDIGANISAITTATTGVIAGTFGVSAAPTVITTTVPNGTQGVAYSQALVGSGGTLPYTWDVSAGALPTGITLSSAGVLSGTPSVNGSFNFTARVTDNAAQQGTRALTLVIAVPASIPVIQTAILPNGTQNVAYSQTLTAIDGVQPYTWSASQLPTGLSLNIDTGVISGTPTAVETVTFNVVVQDSLGAQSTPKSLSITIASAQADAPVSGRPVRWNFMEGVQFRRPTPPTAVDFVETGDVWIKYGPGISPAAHIAERAGDSIVWREWPSNEARVREIAQEEAATGRGPGHVSMLFDYAGRAITPPAGDQEFGNSPRTRQGPLDLTFCKEVMLLVRVLADNANPGCRLHIKYALNLEMGTPFDSAVWSTLHADLSVPIDMGSSWWTPWLPLPAAAITSGVWLSARTISGASVSVSIVSINVSFR